MKSSTHAMSLRHAGAAIVTLLGVGLALPAFAGTLDRIKDTGHMKFGYVENAQPFTFKTSAGTAGGYGVALCEKVAQGVKSKLALGELTVDWVPVTAEDRFSAVEQGNVDLLCTPASDTLTSREKVAFSLPTFPGGVRAVLRSDASDALRDALSGAPSTRPVWRGSPAAKVLEKTTFAVVSNTAAERLLQDRLKLFQIDAKVVNVSDYRAGVQQLRDGKADVFFGDRAVVLGALEGPDRQKVIILDRLLTHEPYALALARNDDDFRLLVDSTLSQTYATPAFGETYKQWLGDFDDGSRAFFAWQARLQ
jgi:polar amino acid transport system substrate-binding protein